MMQNVYKKKMTTKNNKMADKSLDACDQAGPQNKGPVWAWQGK